MSSPNAMHPVRPNGNFRMLEGEIVNATQTLRVPSYDSDPTAGPVMGDVIWQNVADALKVFDGVSWRTIASGSGAGEANAQWSNYTVAPPALQDEYGAQYTTIQDAVDAAVADGASVTNPRVILIATGEYAEDLVCAEGVHYRGMTVRDDLALPGYFPGGVRANVTIAGTVTVNVVPSGPSFLNAICFEAIRIAPTTDTSAVIVGSDNAVSLVFSNCAIESASGNTTPTVSINPNVEGVPFLFCYMHLTQIYNPEATMNAIASTTVGGGTNVELLLTKCTVQGGIVYRGSNVDVRVTETEWNVNGAASSLSLGRWVINRCRVSAEGSGGQISWEQGDAVFNDSQIRVDLASTDGSSMRASRSSFDGSLIMDTPNSVEIAYCDMECDPFSIVNVTQGVSIYHTNIRVQTGVRVTLSANNTQIRMEHCSVSVDSISGSYALDFSTTSGTLTGINWGVVHSYVATNTGPAIFIGGVNMNGLLANSTIQHGDSVNCIVSDSTPPLNSGGNVILGAGAGTGTLVYSALSSV
jgi:hypothetical protein